MGAIAFSSIATLSIVFGVAALLKLQSLSASAVSIGDLIGVGLPLAKVVTAGTIAAEFAVVFGYWADATRATALWCTALLLCAFTVIIIRAARRNTTSSCACFGSASTAPVGRRQVSRNGVLVGLVLVAVMLLPEWDSITWQDVALSIVPIAAMSLIVMRWEDLAAVLFPARPSVRSG